MNLAFDRSVRSYDADGRLHIEITNISKACVNPYRGNEIPNWEALGIDPQKIYKLFRDPKELEKGASTFNNLPLLSQHVPVSAQNPEKDLVVGSTGSDSVFDSPYLKCSLSVWDQESIDAIEDGTKKELSSAYRYEPRMESGEYLGEKYDGVMTNIIGNHVALVEIGRAGSDVVVSDSQPEDLIMKFTKQQFAKRVVPLLAKDSALTFNDFVLLAKKGVDSVKPVLASDIELSTEELSQIIESAAKVEAQEDSTACDEDLTELLKNASPEVLAKIKDLLSPTAQDEDEEEMKEDTKKEDKRESTTTAMDAAIKVAAENAEKNAMRKFKEIRDAEKAVYPLVGEVVAMDSAEAIYKFALDANSVDTAGVHPSAFPSLVKMLVEKTSVQPSPRVAQDSANVADFYAQFPTAKLPKRG